MSAAMQTALTAGSLFIGGVYAYFAPVDRANALPVPFDPASMGCFALDTPPTGWISVGRVLDFQREPQSAMTPVLSGSPASVKTQVRARLQEEIHFTFPAWSRLAVALSGGAETMNLLVEASGANAGPSGGTSAAAAVVLNGSTASVLRFAAGVKIAPGDLLAVDFDYAGETGYLGAGAPGTYVATAPEQDDPQLLRRVTFNVARVLSVAANDGGIAVTLASALPAGLPVAGMKAAPVVGFVDRQGGGFAPEWSALFVLDGMQGDRLLLHYPRLQPMGTGLAEKTTALAPGVDRWQPSAHMRALPVADPLDGAAAICFRTYLPAPMRLV